MAIYDATIAARDSEYTYNRRHPGEVDPGLTTVIVNPRSSSNPSEHAVAAGAASAVLAYIFPDRAAFFAEQAEAAGRSLLLAGVAYPSDVEAGLELPPHAQEQFRCSLWGIRGWRPAHFSVLGPNPRVSAFEYRMDSDAPRAARAYAVFWTTFHDAGVACWDAKYSYG